jgi:uncharacterized protein (DUF58 family)
MGTFAARIRRWMGPPRRFRVTREGKWFIGGTLVLGFAAVNGGINLLFLLFGLLLCLLVANGILAEACMRKLLVRRHIPSAIFTGKPFLMGISVRNEKHRIPTFSLEVEDLSPGGKPVDRRCFFLKVPAGREQETSYRRTLKTRGIHRLVGLRLSTRFPFGLLRRSLDLGLPIEMLAYPALLPVQSPLLRQTLSELGENALPRRSRGGEFHGLREKRPDDDPRDIHWRATARRGRPFVREFEESQGKTVMVTLQEIPASGPEASAMVEAAVSVAASLALAFIKNGYQVGLRAGNSTLPPEQSTAQSTRILRCLALYQPGPIDEPFHFRGATNVQVIPFPGRPRVEIAARSGSTRRKSA